MREGIADIVLEKGHQKRINDADNERINAYEKNSNLKSNSLCQLDSWAT